MIKIKVKFDNRIMINAFFVLMILLYFALPKSGSVVIFTCGGESSSQLFAGGFDGNDSGMHSEQAFLTAGNASIIEASFSSRINSRTSRRFRNGQRRRENRSNFAGTKKITQKEDAKRMAQKNHPVFILRFYHSETSGEEAAPA